jgi:hypothetical protein
MARGMGKLQRTIKALVSKEFAITERHLGAEAPLRWESTLLWGLVSLCFACVLFGIGIMMPTVAIGITSLALGWIFLVLTLLVALRDVEIRRRIVFTIAIPILAGCGIVYFVSCSTRVAPFPWVDVNWPLKDDKGGVGSVAFYVVVRNSRDPFVYGGSWSSASLYHLSIRLTTPVLLLGSNGLQECIVTNIEVPEWNNTDALSKRWPNLKLEREVTFIKIDGTSRNSQWHGGIRIRKKGKGMEVTETIHGWIDSDAGERSEFSIGQVMDEMFRVKEVRKMIDIDKDIDALQKSGIPTQGSGVKPKDCGEIFVQ